MALSTSRSTNSQIAKRNGEVLILYNRKAITGRTFQPQVCKLHGNNQDFEGLSPCPNSFIAKFHRKRCHVSLREVILEMVVNDGRRVMCEATAQLNTFKYKERARRRPPKKTPKNAESRCPLLLTQRRQRATSDVLKNLPEGVQIQCVETIT